MNILGRVATLGHRRHRQIVAARGAVAAGPDTFVTEVRPSPVTAILPPSIFNASGAPSSIWPIALKT